MDPHEQFCHNEGCRAYGRKGEGHVVIHSSAERRYQCKRCKKTFSATKGTPFYRTPKPQGKLVPMVLTLLLAHGCPVQAIVAAFGLDERTVARSLAKRGRDAVRKGA
jgi:transposase-like protein